MLEKTPHLELPRRVTAYYLVFGLAAVGWLTIGVVTVSQSIVSSRAETVCLADLGKAASAVAAEFAGGGASRLQPFVERLGAIKSWAYCAITDKSGRYIAHSCGELVGQAAGEPSGAVVQWGEAVCVRFVDSDSRVLREYRTPVRSSGQAVGTLHLAVVEPGLWGIVGAVAEHAPAALLGPLVLMFFGILVLQRTVRPLTAIENQLHALAVAPSPADVELQPIKAATSAAVGWNRLADRCETARKTNGLESRLTEALEGFRQRKADQILNSLPDGIALCDDRGRVTLANQATVALLGLPGDNSDARGKAMEELLGLEPETEPGKAFLDLDSRARTVVAELSRGGDGSQGLLRVARHPLRGAKASLGAGHVWSIRDITQQKLAEQMRNQFVNSATHELRTPLANIKAYAETLSLSEMLDVDKQKEFCNTINAEATRLARLIDDLLSISSMEVGALTLARQETDVDRMLHEAMDKVRPQMAKKHITLHASLPEKLPKLKLDKDKIAAALINLLGNAAKYTPEGGQVHFKVQAKQDVLQIDVEDTGFGISAEELPKVFDKFFRSSDPRVQKETGSGLGLSLVQEVIRLHGGKLGVQSELNKGTRFTVTLPLG
jgi:two-component system phosphate regulon sensor histidine kinase PhoR